MCACSKRVSNKTKNKNRQRTIYHLFNYLSLLTYIQVPYKNDFFNKPIINYDNEPPLLWIIVIYVNFTCICGIQFILKNQRRLMIKVLSCFAWQYFATEECCFHLEPTKNKVFQIKKESFSFDSCFYFNWCKTKKRQFNLFFRWYYD